MEQMKLHERDPPPGAGEGRDHPRAQLPALRGAAGRRPGRRLARPLREGGRDRRTDDRLRRRALHGREREDPLARQEGGHAARRTPAARSPTRSRSRSCGRCRPSTRVRRRSATSIRPPRSRPRSTSAAPPRTWTRSSPRFPTGRSSSCPDGNMGRYLQRLLPEKEIILWKGVCPTHHRLRAEQVLEQSSGCTRGEVPRAPGVPARGSSNWRTRCARRPVSCATRRRARRRSSSSGRRPGSSRASRPRTPASGSTRPSRRWSART